MKVQRSTVTFPSLHSNKWWRWDLNPTLPTAELSANPPAMVPLTSPGHSTLNEVTLEESGTLTSSLHTGISSPDTKNHSFIRSFIFFMWHLLCATLCLAQGYR